MNTTPELVSTVMQELLTPTSPRPSLRPSKEKFDEWLNFKTYGDPQLETLSAGCMEWYCALKEKLPPRWISMIGKSGNGKTHCGDLLWTWAKSKFDWQRYEFIHDKIYWPDFVQRLR